MPKLFAARYANSDSSPELLEFFNDPAGVGIRCSLHGWVKRFVLTIRAKSRLDAYERYRTHHGMRFAIPDYALDKPVAAGRAYEIVPDGRHVHYICAGAWKEHERELDTTVYSTSALTDAVIKAALSAHVSVVSSDQSNIDSPGTQIGTEWDTRVSTGGIYPTQIIEELLNMSDSSGNIWDYWTLPAPFNGVTLGKPIPYMKARSASAAIDWQVDLKDLRDITYSRHIWDLARDVTTYYGASPTATAGSSSGKTGLWTVQKALRAEEYSLTPANQFEDKHLATFEEPVQQQDFTIGSAFIRDGSGARWPLWEMIKRGPGYIRINDLYPTAVLLASSNDRLRVFFTSALDYDYASNTMRVVPDLPDSRLDALMAREDNVKEAKGEIIQRYSRKFGGGVPMMSGGGLKGR